jgi:hypothetical protein
MGYCGSNFGDATAHCPLVMPKVLSTKHSPKWSAAAANLLKGELKHRGLRYRHLVTLLESIAVIENERSITNKLSRGGFTFVFYLQCMKAIGRTSVTINLAELGIDTESKVLTAPPGARSPAQPPAKPPAES